MDYCHVLESSVLCTSIWYYGSMQRCLSSESGWESSTPLLWSEGSKKLLEHQKNNDIPDQILFSASKNSSQVVCTTEGTKTIQKLIKYFLILDFVWICAEHQVKNLSCLKPAGSMSKVGGPRCLAGKPRVKACETLHGKRICPGGRSFSSSSCSSSSSRCICLWSWFWFDCLLILFKFSDPLLISFIYFFDTYPFWASKGTPRK